VAADEFPTRTGQPAVTVEGQILGTVAYMSPEQAVGGRVDGRSDIFSLGAAMYEMVTGRRPFSGDTAASTLEAILAKDPVPPSAITASVPPELDRTIMRCLRKAPERRWQSMADLRVSLLELRDDLDSGQQPAFAKAGPARTRRRRIIAVVGSLVLLLAASAVAWRIMRPAPRAAGFDAERLTFEGGAGLSPALSPDGKLIAYASNQDGRFSLYLRQPGGRQAIRLTDHQHNDWYPCFSPNGLKIVYRSERDGGGLYLIDALGGPGGADVRLADGGNWPSFSPDGSRIAYLVPSAAGPRARLFLVSSAGGSPRPLQPDIDVVRSGGMFEPALWSPDGASVLFDGTRADDPASRGWWIAPVAAGAAARLEGAQPVPPWQARLALAWLGHFVYYAEGEPLNGSRVYRLPLAERPWRVAGPAEMIASTAGIQLTGSISAQGRMGFDSVISTTNVWSAPLGTDRRASGQLTRVTADGTAKRNVSVSADGLKLTYGTYGSPGQANVDVRIRNVTTGQESLIAGSGKWPFVDPVLARDGSKVAYADAPDRDVVWYVANASETSGRAVCESCRVLGFSGDDAVLVASKNRLQRQPLAGGNVSTLADVPSLLDVALSPDGSRIAFTQGRSDGSVALYLADIATTLADPRSWALVAEDRNLLLAPAWSPDGRSLYYVSQSDGFPCVWARPVGRDGRPLGDAFAVLHVHPGSGVFSRYSRLAVANGRLNMLVTELRSEVYAVTIAR
jgi:eukaryotic-like serine/threonine-protein kinase